MKLYYTAHKEGFVQNKIEQSIGGFQSLNSIPNEQISNIFNDLSQLALQDKKDEYFAFILKNELGYDVEDIEVYFDYPINSLDQQTNFCKFEIAAVLLNSSGFMERVANRNSKPYNAEFYSADGVDNAVGLGTLANNGLLGIWLKRSLIQDRVDQALSEQKLIEDFNNSVQLDEVEKISMKINWTTAGYYGGGVGGNNI